MTCPTCKKEPRFGCPECRRRAKPPSITTEQARELMKEGAKLQGALKPRIEKMQRPVDLETEYFQAKEEWKARAEAAEKDAARWRTTSEENEDIALAAEKRARDIESELVDTRVELEAAQGSNDVLAAKLEAAERETKRHQARADEWIHACLEAFPSPSHVGRDVRAFRVKQDVESLRNELADAERMTEGLTIAAVIAWLEKRAYDGNEHEIALMVDAIARGDWRPKGREGGDE